MKNSLRFLFNAIIALMLANNAAFAATDTKSLLSSGEAKLKAKDYTGAITDFTQALELNPKNAEVYLNRGLAKRSAGDIEGAKADFKSSIERLTQPLKMLPLTIRGVLRNQLLVIIMEHCQTIKGLPPMEMPMPRHG